ncbi:LysR substrate-binding domain-containing protein [Prauserella muralis]|uniref:LysR family transcriptional regulator n=1 Tax=Prauserella muralis TaxID=588067 RepID=A0A2V4AFU4_9PSEU|nr:LysR substrate-binding domain-containing protein [Prauserella muralis]PXY18815.1 LysR family transcriptional regulator [Prauserella muralis]TWE28667.1 DNA-binding transcriptional LysR family regulator [Prauserella muralis]
MEKLSNLPGFSLRQLWYFVAAAEEGTISAAANRLHVSQSAVSLALGELERALKVQLCVRRKAHGITLTPSGTQVLQQARALLRQAEDLEETSAGDSADLAGRLALGCYLTLAPTVLPRLLHGFGARYPRVTIDFTEGTQDALQRLLLAGELDLAVLYDMEILPEIAQVPLYHRRPHVLLPADHRLAGEPEVALHDLADEPMVLLDAPPSSHHTLRLCTDAGVKPMVRHRTSSFETARALVGRGLGYAMLIQRPANDRTYEGLPVVSKSISELSGYAVSVLLAWPRHTRLTRRSAEFVAYCEEVFAGESS